MATVSPIRLCLREVRETRGLTQKELSDRSGVRRATISDMENGKTSGVDFDVLERLANALDTDAALLIRHDREGR